MILGSLIIVSSCTKDDANETTNPTPSQSSATIDGTTVSATETPTMPDKTAVLKTSQGTFEIQFASKPTESGAYTVKSSIATGKGLAVATKEVTFVYKDNQNLTYKANDGTGGSVTITIKDGNMVIDIVNITVCNGSTCKKVSAKYEFAYTPPTVNPNPVEPNPTTSLSPNEFQIGSKVYKTDETPAWHGNNGYLGFSGGIGNQFKPIFSKKNPASGTYKVVSVLTSLSTVSDGEIGISATVGYLTKAITANTGKATVINDKGQVTIIISDVTMGNDKFSAHYVIGDKNKHIFADGRLLDPMYSEAKSEAEYSNVYKTRIKTYGSETSTTESWSFVFYFGANGLNDGDYKSIGAPSLLQNIPAGSVHIIADKGYSQFKSTSTSGTITVKGKKIIFTNFAITTSNSETVKITGEYQF